MSYYFAIVGTKDNPLFEYEFGTAKQGGDGVSKFREEAKHMNQFIVHSSIDIVEEIQWTNGCMYHKVIDRFYNNYISLFLTGGNIKFLLLHCPDPVLTNPPSSPYDASAAGASSSRTSTARITSSSAIGANPTSPATEEAIRQFLAEVYEHWVKTVMNPFYVVNMPAKSPVFRQRVIAAGKKYL